MAVEIILKEPKEIIAVIWVEIVHTQITTEIQSIRLVCFEI